MNQWNQYDVIVIGAGSAGYVSAIKAAQLGKRVAIVERDQLGGTCLNRGCIPTKTLLHVAEIFHQQKEYSLLGIEGQLTVNPKVINDRKDEVINQLKQGIASLLQANQIEVISGEARIVDSQTVQINDIQLHTTNIVIATGSSIASIPIPGIEYAYTSDEILQFSDKLFDDVIIIGGGVIGVEFASIYQMLGIKVTVLEAQDRLLGVFDKEVSQNLTMILKRRGVSIHCHSVVKEIRKVVDINTTTTSTSVPRYEVVYEAKGKEVVIAAQGVLVAVGRKANGIASDIELVYDKSRLVVNEHFQTNVPNIYAVGDASSPIQLAHLASHQGIHAILHMFGQDIASIKAIPMCVYTSPEIASVGLSEQEAKNKGIPCITGKYMTLGNGKTIIANQDRGFVKIVVDELNQTIIGAQLMCDRASDMIPIFTQAIASRLTLTQMQEVVYPHPSFGEAIHEALCDVSKQAIHVMPKKKIG